MKKLRVGIFFGGASKEREVSFAGGRTVYDNLDKTLFDAVPIFVDSFNNLVALKWEYIYKGSIRDFYPPVQFYPPNNEHFQLYAESLPTQTNGIEFLAELGEIIHPHELKNKIDFAFLALHGPFGEDGKIQGLLDFLKIPFSGSGILPSAIGIDKSIQKSLMQRAGFAVPQMLIIDREKYISGKYKSLFEQAKQQIGFPMVIKPANQGSSIGISILKNDVAEYQFMEAVEKALFTKWIDAKWWNVQSQNDKTEFIKKLIDIREGIGLPVLFGEKEELIYNPNDLIIKLNKNLKNSDDGVVLQSTDAESTVIIEGFIKGKEFSCVVIQDQENKPIALPPTQIIKGDDLFDYRKKYLPGLSRKITPISIDTSLIQKIRTACEELFVSLHFNVYARIDGFITDDNTVFLNDPNTTSGMMPSSFFFHQAAEIGLNPSQFLTYIINISLIQRCKEAKLNLQYNQLLNQLDELIAHHKNSSIKKQRVAVILGGYSSERHISVESGRNIYEKLASSNKYIPYPIFLTGSSNNIQLYRIPIQILLKDNADDIKEKVENYQPHPILQIIKKECIVITTKYAHDNALHSPEKIDINDLKNLVDVVFIALHGRPGEDGQLQLILEKINLPYNGSPESSSKITINKYETTELFLKNGLLAAKHDLIKKSHWIKNKEEAISFIEKNYTYPFICKPLDDGCSSAVKKIKNKNELQAFANLLFRDTEDLDIAASEILNIKPKEEFPAKEILLVEELISKNNAKHFLEITGGMLTHYKNNELAYELFEASETLTEGDVLSLEEKFLAGQGQNLTPARYSSNNTDRQKISDKIKQDFEKAARLINIQGYCRIDAFVRIFDANKVETIFIEVNSLPGMTPATCIFHQTAINGYKPYEFIDKILQFGIQRNQMQHIIN